MSSLRLTDKAMLERFFGMKSGYVCDFSDRTFAEFIQESTGIDIDAEEYAQNGTSKANRLRTLWSKESDQLNTKLLDDMLGYWRTQKILSNNGVGLTAQETILYEECAKVLSRLRETADTQDITALTPNSDDSDFASLASSIQASIKQGKANEALDRLHTFLVKYVRELCRRHSISHDKNTPLHGLFGQYVKHIERQGLITAEMSKKIIKSSIQILESFNKVRNDYSFAHDNKLLDNDEATLIFNNISNTLRFLDVLEGRIKVTSRVIPKREVLWEDVAFSDEEAESAADRWAQEQVDIARGK
jgi:hypothetical protein